MSLNALTALLSLKWLKTDAVFFNLFILVDKLKINSLKRPKAKNGDHHNDVSLGDEQLFVQTEDTEQAEMCSKKRRFIVEGMLQEHPCY